MRMLATMLLMGLMVLNALAGDQAGLPLDCVIVPPSDKFQIRPAVTAAADREGPLIYRERPTPEWMAEHAPACILIRVYVRVDANTIKFIGYTWIERIVNDQDHVDDTTP
jgi:hypothetical protein